MMKAFYKNRLFLVVTFFVNVTLFAANPPNPGVAPAPGSPIDDNILVLVLVSMLFGCYKIYQFNKKKASI